MLESDARGANEISDQEVLQAQLAKISGSDNLLMVEEFINPPAEKIDDQNEDIMEAIIETYSEDLEHQEKKLCANDLPMVPMACQLCQLYHFCMSIILAPITVQCTCHYKAHAL